MKNFKGGNFTVPKGDSLEFDLVIRQKPLELDDTVVLSIKKNITDEDTIIRKEYRGIHHWGNVVHVVLDNEDMKKLDVGTYVYDLVAKGDKFKMLILGPAKIKITEVVNNE